MSFESLKYEVRDGLAIITLNRPEKRNALDISMRTELSEVVLDIRNDTTLYAVIITGAGGAFCAGGDIQSMAKGKRTSFESRKRIQDIYSWLYEWVSLELPVIAAVDGAAYGAGINIALAADFILASTRARFCEVFGRVGLIPDVGGLFLLPRIVGLQRAKELVFSARSFDAKEGKDLGIVYAIHEPDKLMDAAIELAGRFRNASRQAIGLSKNIMNQSFNLDFRALGELEAFGQAVAHDTEYHSAAVKRFLDKEPTLFDWDRMQKKDGA
ncbi:MAG: enoyl-CoA hydratase/isomerase family protein [Alphaproteobacteria bacterium]|nr:enoyl-CoA hydratase/isomerase family protein [Alphaproteobacteria bacterium]